jgi:hypothetical protein
MAKGIYPAITYVLLFSVGVVFSALIYNFTSNSLTNKQINLENAQGDRICAYLEDLAGKDGEVTIDIRDYRLESSPLRVIGKFEHVCASNLSVEGSCSGECVVRANSEGVLSLSVP